MAKQRSTRRARQVEPIARALTHHGVSFRPPLDRQPHFLVETTHGTTEMTIDQAYYFALGLALAEKMRAKEDTVMRQLVDDDA